MPGITGIMLLKTLKRNIDWLQCFLWSLGPSNCRKRLHEDKRPYIETWCHVCFSFLSLCGTTSAANNIQDFTTQLAVEPDTLLVVFVGAASTPQNGKFQFTVTAETDPCIGDPCHGVPCTPQESAGQKYQCVFPGKGIPNILQLHASALLSHAANV